MALGLTQSHIQWVMEALPPLVKWPRHEALFSATVGNLWSYTSTIPYAFMTCAGAALHLTFITCLKNKNLYINLRYEFVTAVNIKITVSAT